MSGYTRRKNFCMTVHVTSSHFALNIETMRNVGWQRKIDYFKSSMPVTRRFSVIASLHRACSMSQNFTTTFLLVLLSATRNSRFIF